MPDENGGSFVSKKKITSSPGETQRGLSSDTSRIVISSHFKMVWLTITALTLLLTLADLAMSIMLKHPTLAAQNAITMCDNVSKLGYGAIFGLLGGKALS